MDQPTLYPRWADIPPVGPPSTITEPSSPEKDVGFQPNNIAQVVNVTFAGNANGTYQIVLNSVTSQFVAAGSTLTQIITGLVNDIIADGQPITPLNVGGTVLRLTATTPGVAFTFAANSSGGASAMTATLATANKSAKPIRQFINWLFNLIYMWIAWLDQIAFSTEDIFGDQALPGGTPPPTGAGLGPIAANNFSARVFVNGRSVGLISSPVHTYGATTDTYWDLGVDGVWTPVVVAALAAEPAVTADSIRVYRVRTNATDRTAVLDRRRLRVTIRKAIDVTGGVRHTPEGISAGGSPTAGQTIQALDTTVIDGVAASQLLHDLIENHNVLTPMHTYAALSSSLGVTYVWGAVRTGASTWTVENTEAFRLDVIPLGANRGIRFKRMTGLTPTATFADSTWDDQLAANSTRLQLPLGFGLKLGGDEMGQEDGLDANLTPLIEWVRNAGGADRTLLSEDRTAGSQSISEYISVESGFVSYERVQNATWDDSANLWGRTLAGQPSWRFTMNAGGYFMDTHASAAAATWATAAWTSVAGFTATGTTLANDLTIGDDLTVTGDLAVTGTTTIQGVTTVNDTILVTGLIEGQNGLDITGASVIDGALGITGATTGTRLTLSEKDNTPLPNTLYAGSILKAHGTIVIVAGGLSVLPLFGCTAAFSGLSLILTLTTPLLVSGTDPNTIVIGHGLLRPSTRILSEIGGAQATIQFWDSTGANQEDPTSGSFSFVFSFAIFGQQ